MNTIEHARAEWGFFRRAHCLHAKAIRRMWAQHYAKLRGWAERGPFITDP